MLCSLKCWRGATSYSCSRLCPRASAPLRPTLSRYGTVVVSPQGITSVPHALRKGTVSLLILC